MGVKPHKNTPYLEWVNEDDDDAVRIGFFVSEVMKNRYTNYTEGILGTKLRYNGTNWVIFEQKSKMPIDDVAKYFPDKSIPTTKAKSIPTDDVVKILLKTSHGYGEGAGFTNAKHKPVARGIKWGDFLRGVKVCDNVVWDGEWKENPKLTGSEFYISKIAKKKLQEAGLIRRRLVNPALLDRLDHC